MSPHPWRQSGIKRITPERNREQNGGQIHPLGIPLKKNAEFLKEGESKKTIYE